MPVLSVNSPFFGFASRSRHAAMFLFSSCLLSGVHRSLLHAWPFNVYLESLFSIQVYPIFQSCLKHRQHAT